MQAKNSRSGVNGGLILLIGAALGLWIVMGLLGHFFATAYQEVAVEEGRHFGRVADRRFSCPSCPQADGWSGHCRPKATPN